LIRCLGGEVYEIFDEKSENGTFMNDEQVPVSGMPLKDRARIRTGATVWTFIAIRPPSSERRSQAEDEEGFGKENDTEEPDPADAMIEAAEDLSEHRQPHRRPTVPYVDDKPQAREGRRPTTILGQPDSGPEREERASEAPPVQAEEELPNRRPRDKTKVHDSEEPVARGRDDRTKFF
jgi:hypothetical protein